MPLMSELTTLPTNSIISFTSVAISIHLRMRNCRFNLELDENHDSENCIIIFGQQKSDSVEVNTQPMFPPCVSDLMLEFFPF